MPSDLYFSLEIEGKRELSTRIHGILYAVRDWRPAFRAIAADLVNVWAKRFAAEGAVEGDQPWAALKPGYAQWKAKHFPGAKILTRTGELKAAVTNPEVELGPQQLRISVHSKVAVFHQHGTRTMPARNLISLTKKQPGRIVRALREQIRAAAQK